MLTDRDQVSWLDPNSATGEAGGTLVVGRDGRDGVANELAGGRIPPVRSGRFRGPTVAMAQRSGSEVLPGSCMGMTANLKPSIQNRASWAHADCWEAPPGCLRRKTFFEARGMRTS